MCIILPDQVLLDKFTGSVHYHQKLCSGSDFLKSNLLSVKTLFRGNFHSSVKSDAIHYCISAEGTSGFTLTLPDQSLSTLIASFAVWDKHRILWLCEANHAHFDFTFVGLLIHLLILTLVDNLTHDNNDVTFRWETLTQFSQPFTLGHAHAIVNGILPAWNFIRPWLDRQFMYRWKDGRGYSDLNPERGVDALWVSACASLRFTGWQSGLYPRIQPTHTLPDWRATAACRAVIPRPFGSLLSNKVNTAAC